MMHSRSFDREEDEVEDEVEDEAMKLVLPPAALRGKEGRESFVLLTCSLHRITY